MLKTGVPVVLAFSFRGYGRRRPTSVQIGNRFSYGLSQPIPHSHSHPHHPIPIPGSGIHRVLRVLLVQGRRVIPSSPFLRRLLIYAPDRTTVSTFVRFYLRPVLRSSYSTRETEDAACYAGRYAELRPRRLRFFSSLRRRCSNRLRHCRHPRSIHFSANAYFAYKASARSRGAALQLNARRPPACTSDTLSARLSRQLVNQQLGLSFSVSLVPFFVPPFAFRFLSTEHRTPLSDETGHFGRNAGPISR